jgi:tetratricopeptide (TPR) repeat protein
VSTWPGILSSYQRIGLGFFLYLSIQAAVAATPIADLQTEVDLLLKSGKPAEAMALLNAHKDDQSSDPEFNYLLGTTALQSNQLELALSAFERAVLLQPSFAGAWVDLAITYYRLGDVQTAKQLIAHVETNFTPPTAIKAELDKARNTIDQAAFLNEWHGEVAMLAGHVKNANYGISSSNLQLTSVNDGLINVVLSPDYKPRDDNAMEFRAGASKRINHASGAYSDVQLGMRTRQYGTEHNQDYIDMAGNWTFVKPLAGFKATEQMLSLTARRVLLDGRGLGAFINLAAGVKKAYGRCVAATNLEFEKRLYEGQGQFDADIPWLGLGMECSLGAYALEANYRIGYDQAHGSRPGGDTRRQEFRLQAGWQIDPSLYLRGTAYYVDNQDQEGYSELLSYNAKRYTHRLGQRIELNWLLPFDPKQRWNLKVEFENLDNRSNIAIARFEDTQIFMGLNYKLF